MKTLKTILIFLMMFQLTSFANEETTLLQNEFENNTVSIASNSYKILKFKKDITNIKLTDSKKILVEFISNDFKSLKVLAKETGNANAFISFDDSSSMQINFNIVPNIQSAIELLKNEYPKVSITQVDNSIILKGEVSSEKDKKRVLDIFKKIDINSENKIVNMIKAVNPTKMVRVKLYVVEINNQKGLNIKNNWGLSGSNSDVSLSVSSIMLNAVTLSGGITATANALGNSFNPSLTLQYLKNESVAKILDETTLITLENNKSQFHSGGLFNVKIATTDSSRLERIAYGLKMDVEVQEIINDGYVKLLIRTESSVLDTVNMVDGVPSTKNKTVDTNVVVGNKSTIVLGGLVNIEKSKAEEKVPLLGDIPIIGKIFTSTSDTNDDVELVFFITPEIIDPSANDQIEELNIKKLQTEK